MSNRLIIGLLMAGVVAACGPSGDDSRAAGNQTIVLDDAWGNRVAMDGPAATVVCLFDPIVDLMYMLGAEEKLVGIPVEMYTDGELFRPYAAIDGRVARKELPTPGSNESVSLESVVQLRPDLLVVQHLNKGMAETLNRMGIAVYCARSQSQEDVFKELADMAALLGKTERADSLADFGRRELVAMKQAVQPIDVRKKVYFTWANGRVFSTVGRTGMMQRCLDYAGVANACPVVMDQPNINAETLVGWNPDMIVMWNDSPDVFYRKPELATITAIRQRQIFNLMPMFFYNPHTLKAICASRAIHGWAYGDARAAGAEVRRVIGELYAPQSTTELLTLLTDND